MTTISPAVFIESVIGRIKRSVGGSGKEHCRYGEPGFVWSNTLIS